jgi:hypothetical protein
MGVRLAVSKISAEHVRGSLNYVKRKKGKP